MNYIKKFALLLSSFKLIFVHPFVRSQYEDINLVDKYTYFRYRYLFLPKKYKRHRQFFRSDKRGFGEDAFHAVWKYIFSKYKPSSCLEIGVYRGQTISLWKMIQLEMKIDGCIQGLTPLSSIDDAVSEYVEINYYDDISKNYGFFDLGSPNIVEGMSTSEAVKRQFATDSYDLVYVDGGHDYETVLNDYIFSLRILKNGGVLCFDDSSLYFETEGKFKGHPGPSAVVTQFALKELDYLFTAGHLNFFRKPMPVVIR
jgi:hypothetical protein